jgi:hypothetical protein
VRARDGKFFQRTPQDTFVRRRTRT